MSASTIRQAVDQMMTRGCSRRDAASGIERALWRDGCATGNCVNDDKYAPWNYLQLEQAAPRACDQPHGMHCVSEVAPWAMSDPTATAAREDLWNSPACSWNVVQRGYQPGTGFDRSNYVDSVAHTHADYLVTNCAEQPLITSSDWLPARVCEGERTRLCQTNTDCGGNRCVDLTSGGGRARRDAQPFGNLNVYKGCYKSTSAAKKMITRSLHPASVGVTAATLGLAAPAVAAYAVTSALLEGDDEDTSKQLRYYVRNPTSYGSDPELAAQKRACCLGGGTFQQKRRPLGAMCAEDDDCVTTTAEGEPTDVVCAPPACVADSDCPQESFCDKTEAKAEDSRFANPSGSYCLEKKCIRVADKPGSTYEKAGRARYNRGCRTVADCGDTDSDRNQWRCGYAECQIHPDGRVARDEEPGDEVSRRLAIPTKQTPSADPATWGADYRERFQTGPEGCGYNARTYWNPQGWGAHGNGATAVDAQPCVRAVGVCRPRPGSERRVMGVCKRASATRVTANTSKDECPSAIPGATIVQSYNLDRIADLFGHHKYGMCPLLSSSGATSNAMAGNDMPNLFNEVDSATGSQIRNCPSHWAPMHSGSGLYKAPDVRRWVAECGPVYDEWCAEPVQPGAAADLSGLDTSLPFGDKQHWVMPALFLTAEPGAMQNLDECPGLGGTVVCDHGVTAPDECASLGGSVHASGRCHSDLSSASNPNSAVCEGTRRCLLLKPNEIIVPTVRPDVFKSWFAAEDKSRWPVSALGELDLEALHFCEENPDRRCDPDEAQAGCTCRSVVAENARGVRGEVPLRLRTVMGMTGAQLVRSKPGGVVFAPTSQIDNVGLVAPACGLGPQDVNCSYDTTTPMGLAKHPGVGMASLLSDFDEGGTGLARKGIRFAYDPHIYRLRIDPAYKTYDVRTSPILQSIQRQFGLSPDFYRFSKVALYREDTAISGAQACQSAGAENVWDDAHSRCLTPAPVPRRQSSTTGRYVSPFADEDQNTCGEIGGTFASVCPATGESCDASCPEDCETQCLAPPACLPRCVQKTRADGTLDCDSQPGCTLSLGGNRCVMKTRPAITGAEVGCSPDGGSTSLSADVGRACDLGACRRPGVCVGGDREGRACTAITDDEVETECGANSRCDRSGAYLAGTCRNSSNEDASSKRLCLGTVDVSKTSDKDCTSDSNQWVGCSPLGLYCSYPNPLKQSADELNMSPGDREQRCGLLDAAFQAAATSGGATWDGGECLLEAGTSYCASSFAPCDLATNVEQGGQVVSPDCGGSEACLVARPKRNQGTQCVAVSNACPSEETCVFRPTAATCERDPRIFCSTDFDCRGVRACEAVENPSESTCDAQGCGFRNGACVAPGATSCGAIASGVCMVPVGTHVGSGGAGERRTIYREDTTRTEASQCTNDNEYFASVRLRCNNSDPGSAAAGQCEYSEARGECMGQPGIECVRAFAKVRPFGPMPTSLHGARACMNAKNWNSCSDPNLPGCESGSQYCASMELDASTRDHYGGRYDGVPRFYQYGIPLEHSFTVGGQAPYGMAMVVETNETDAVLRWQAGREHGGDVCRAYARGRLSDNGTVQQDWPLSREAAAPRRSCAIAV